MKTPSNFFLGSFNAFRTQFNENGIIEIAHQKYRPKSFLEENRGRYHLAQVSLFLFQILSAVFAFTFVNQLIINLLPKFGFDEILAGFSAGLFLILLEIAKKSFLGAFVESIIKAKAVKNGFKIKLENGFISLILITLSVFSSVEGAKMWATNATDKTTQIQLENKRKASQIKQDYASKLKQVEANIQALQAKEISRNWGLTEMESKSLEANRTEYNRLIAEQNKNLQSIDNQVINELSENKGNTSKTVMYMLIASLIVEAFTLLSIWFIGYYLGYVFVEAVENGTLPTNPIPASNQQIENNEIKELLGYFRNLIANNQPMPSYTATAQEIEPVLAENQQKIGFEIHPENEKNWRPRGAVINYKKMQDLINKGLNNREVATVLKCSESAVKRFKQAQSESSKS
jgi:hypothetical protein